jgi:hypothetical protein
MFHSSVGNTVNVFFNMKILLFLGLILSKTVSKLGKLLINLHNNMSTCEVQKILDFGHRNLGFEEFELGTSDLVDRFFRYFFG